MSQATVQQIYRDLREQLELELLTELPENDLPIYAQDVHRPGMAVMGFTENFLPRRIQVVGESEMAYLSSLDADEQVIAFEHVISLDPPALFVTRGRTLPDPVLTQATERGFPVFRTQLPAVEFIAELTRYLERKFAPRTEVHGTLVDVYGVGLLFTGRSGIGKSECALDLIERGHRLVADDIVKIRKREDGVLIGSFREVLRHNIEIRGLGVIDVQAIFGVRAIRMQKRIEVDVQLQEWDDDVDYERVGMQRRYTEILGVQIPQVVVPLFPGKNITVLSEVIALDFMLNVYGYDAAELLNQRIVDTMRTNRRLRRYLEQDLE